MILDAASVVVVRAAATRSRIDLPLITKPEFSRRICCFFGFRPSDGRTTQVRYTVEKIIYKLREIEVFLLEAFLDQQRTAAIGDGGSILPSAFTQN